MFERRHVQTFLTVVTVLVAGCTIKNPVEDEAVVPVLSDLITASTIYLRTDVEYPVSVKVSDPQGVDDILSVRCFVFPEDGDAPVWEDTLRDNGRGGDIIPRDGVFWGHLSVDFAGGRIGTYQLGVVAEDVGQHMSDTLFTRITVVDGEKNLPPVLSDPVVPDTLTAGSLGDVFLSIRGWDTQGLEDIDTVRFAVYPPTSPVPSFVGELRDDGAGGDEVAGDGVFSTRTDLADDLLDPPILSDIVAPDTVSRSATEPFLLSVRVSDSQGLGDVRAVYFVVTKPDGTPAAGSPFLMYDDGDEETNGDSVAGDGIYSLLVVITPQNDKGTYRFDFFAEDYSQGVGRCLFRFQAQDRGGVKSDAVVAEVVAVLGGTVSEPLTHLMVVVD